MLSRPGLRYRHFASLAQVADWMVSSTEPQNGGESLLQETLNGDSRIGEHLPHGPDVGSNAQAAGVYATQGISPGTGKPAGEGEMQHKTSFV